MPKAPLFATNIQEYRYLRKLQLPEMHVRHPIIFARVQSEATSTPDQILFTAPDAATLRSMLFQLLIPDYLPGHVIDISGEGFLNSQLRRSIETIERQQQQEKINLKGIPRQNRKISLHDDICLSFLAGEDIPSDLGMISKTWAVFELDVTAYSRRRSLPDRNAPIDRFYDFLVGFADKFSE